MDSFNGIFSFQNQQKTLQLPDTYQEFIHMIQTQFNITQFQAEVVFADSKMQLSQESDYRKLRKNRDLSMKQINIKSLNVCKEESVEFYDYFLKNKEIECCLKKECPLCQGNGEAQITDQDQNLLNKLIKQRLLERMEDIKNTLFKRYKLKLQTPEDFLNYHKIREVQMQKQQQKLKQQYIQNERKIQIYSARLTGPINEITAQPSKDKIIEIEMLNDGNEDWPQQVFFKCMDGQFQINEQVKSLKVREKTVQKIKIYVPKMQCQTYSFECSLSYLYNQVDQFFGEKLILIITVKYLEVTPENDFEEDYEEKNNKLIPELRSNLAQMGYEEDYINEKIRTILDKYINRRLTMNLFFEEYLD